MSEQPTVNTHESLKILYSSCGLSYWPIILFVPARFVYAFLAQGLVAGLFYFRGSTHAWQDAAAWWPVYSTMTDILCLLSLARLTRRENITIADLFGARGKVILKQLARTPLYLLAVIPGTILANIITTAFYGPALPPMITVVRLSPAGLWYGLIVWPVIWVITEELVYLGYLFPRLEALSGRTWIAIFIVTFFWGFQHLAIPFLPDERYLVSRVLAAIAAVSTFAIVFALRRRLVPLMGVHYVADLSTAILMGFLS